MLVVESNVPAAQMVSGLVSVVEQEKGEKAHQNPKHRAENSDPE
jgi:hypothetical protein